jgi:hypothetical protein
LLQEVYEVAVADELRSIAARQLESTDMRIEGSWRGKSCRQMEEALERIIYETP